MVSGSVDYPSDISFSISDNGIYFGYTEHDFTHFFYSFLYFLQPIFHLKVYLKYNNNNHNNNNNNDDSKNNDKNKQLFQFLFLNHSLTCRGHAKG